MVGEHLGVILRSTEPTRSTPRRARCFAARSARGIWPYDDVADERVRERELALALERRAPLAADEALALERVERCRGRVAASRPSELAQNTLPTTAASCSRLFSVSGRPSSARGDDALERLREAAARPSNPARGRARRTAPRTAGCRPRARAERAGRRPRAPDVPRRLPMSSRRLLVRERRERERRRVQLAAAPVRAALEQLGPGGRDDEQRHVASPSRRARRRSRGGSRRPSGCPRRRGRAGAARRAPRGSGARRRTPRCGDRRRAALSPARPRSARRCDSTQRFVARAGERVLDGLADLLGDLLRRVLLEDAGLRLDDLAERPQRDAVAVGEAAALAPRDELGVGVDDAAGARRRAGSCRCRGRRRA